MYRHLAEGQHWLFPDLADLRAKASPPRTGDMLAGVGAERATQRVAARMAMSPRAAPWRSSAAAQKASSPTASAATRRGDFPAKGARRR